MSKKYTLDRVEERQYVFLEHPEEINQLIIPVNEIQGQIAEGNIVLISKSESGYEIEVQEEETEITRDKVNALLEKLKNKK
ncbi:DUF3006 family protein [Sporosarcina sp. FSL K6-3508]|uniref:DUF3006 family protein n=1 Tax=Sporosarcina sp. FSL K6-3508 TaxID=2921557 RepID=UPI003159DED7